MKILAPYSLLLILFIGVGSSLYSCTNEKYVLHYPIQFHSLHQVQLNNKDELENRHPEEKVTGNLQADVNFNRLLLKEFQEKHSHIVAFGDSLTLGIGDETGQGGHIGILNTILNSGEKQIQFNIFGKRGSRSKQLADRLETEEVKGAIERADIVLITIGANDIMQVAKENMTDLSLQDFVEARTLFEEQIRKIILRIKAFQKDAQIYFLGFYNPFERYFQDIKEVQIIVQEWNNAVEEIAKKSDKTYFIPVADLFQGQQLPLFAEDHFHPNYAGYVKIANRILEYLLLKRVD